MSPHDTGADKRYNYKISPSILKLKIENNNNDRTGDTCSYFITAKYTYEHHIFTNRRKVLMLYLSYYNLEKLKPLTNHLYSLERKETSKTP